MTKYLIGGVGLVLATISAGEIAQSPWWTIGLGIGALVNAVALRSQEITIGRQERSR